MRKLALLTILCALAAGCGRTRSWRYDGDRCLGGCRSAPPAPVHDCHDCGTTSSYTPYHSDTIIDGGVIDNSYYGGDYVVPNSTTTSPSMGTISPPT